MAERRTPADILNLHEKDAAAFLRAENADPEEFVSTYEQLRATMPLQCINCPTLATFAIRVAAGEMTFGEVCEDRATEFVPQDCGGAQLKIFEYYNKEGELDGQPEYICLSRTFGH